MKLLNWIKSLFIGHTEQEIEVKIRKPRKVLSKNDVLKIEQFMQSWSIELTAEYFDISIATAYRIKNHTHKYSSIAKYKSF